MNFFFIVRFELNANLFKSVYFDYVVFVFYFFLDCLTNRYYIEYTTYTTYTTNVDYLVSSFNEMKV